MTLEALLNEGVAALLTGHLPEARLDAEVLLMYVTGLDRARLYLALKKPASPEVVQAFRSLVQRRLNREPTAYIVGHKEFYGLDFLVDQRALIPRPESELLVQAALAFAESLPTCRSILVADVGTGSGALAVSLARHCRPALVSATDCSAAALQVAAVNCRRHGVARRVRLLYGDLMTPVDGPLDIVMANLPYIPQNQLDSLAPEIQRFEPLVALNGGQTGLGHIERLLPQVKEHLRGPGALLLEVGDGQADRVAELAGETFPQAEVRVQSDYGGVPRLVAVYLRG